MPGVWSLSLLMMLVVLTMHCSVEGQASQIQKPRVSLDYDTCLLSPTLFSGNNLLNFRLNQLVSFWMNRLVLRVSFRVEDMADPILT